LFGRKGRFLVPANHPRAPRGTAVKGARQRGAQRFTLDGREHGATLGKPGQTKSKERQCPK